MVSVTLAVSPEIKREMDRYEEINWSAFIRNAIKAKAEELRWREDVMGAIEKDTQQEFLERMKEPKVRKEYLEKIAKIRAHGTFKEIDPDDFV